MSRPTAPRFSLRPAAWGLKALFRSASTRPIGPGGHATGSRKKSGLSGDAEGAGGAVLAEDIESGIAPREAECPSVAVPLATFGQSFLMLR